MLKTTVINHFGSPAIVARFLKISPPAVHYWGEVIPYGRALSLEKMTGGALTYDESLYDQTDQAEQSKAVS